MTATTYTSTDPRAALPATLTTGLLERLTERVTASPGAPRSITTAPYTGSPLADFPVSAPADVDEAFVRARRAQARWAATSVAERASVLLRFHDLVLKNQNTGLDLMQAENGKTRRDAYLEIADAAIAARYYGRTGPKVLEPERRRGALPFLTRTSELHHPKGVVAIISPWNYPLSMAATDAIAALMAGNAVVQKPDTQTALTALWAMDLMYQAGLPADVWQMVIGRGSSIGDPLLANADYIMFTGSTATGRDIARGAGQRLIGASLELGGKNAMLVLDDADLDRAAEGAVRAAFPSAGQLCVSVERLYVAESVHDEFVAKFVQRTSALTIGASYDYGVDVGSLTTDKQLKTVSAHVDDAVAKGARLLAGGKPRPDLGPLFYEPTILADVTPEMTLHTDETFGPVVSIYAVADDDEAVARAHDTVYGLNSSVWGRDATRARSVAARLRSGTVNINDAFAAAWGSIDSPMGGMGDSGLGRRHGIDGILKYTEAQTIAHQSRFGFYPPAGIPWNAWAPVVNAALRIWKTIGAR